MSAGEVEATLAAVRRVDLSFVPDGRWACVRELCGIDEERVDGTDTLQALRLLDGLLVAKPGAAVAPGQAATLTVPERDLVMAGVYRGAFGDRVNGTATCRRCDERFDVDFDLGAMIESVSIERRAAPPRPEDGVFAVSPGCRFRLPTGADECAVMGLPPARAEQELLRRCLVAGDCEQHRAAVLDAMERVGRGLDPALTATCPECATAQEIPFDIQSHLLGALRGRRDALAAQVHALALSYRWGLREILSLSTRRREQLVGLLDHAAAPRRMRA